MIIKSILIALVLFIAGCSSVDINKNSIPLNLITRAAVSRALIEHPDWARPAYGITEQAINLLQGNKIVKIDELEKYIRKEIQWDKLTIDEQVLMDALIMTVKDSIEQYLQDNNLSTTSDTKIHLIKVLIWINETAYRYTLEEPNGKP